MTEFSFDDADGGGGKNNRGIDPALLQSECAVGVKLPQADEGIGRLSVKKWFSGNRAAHEQGVFYPQSHVGCQHRYHSDDHRRRMMPGSRLKGLRSHHHSDPDENGHARLDRDEIDDETERSGKTDDRPDDGVEGRVTGPRPDRLPTGMADVNGGRERRPAKSRPDCPQTVESERWFALEGITRGGREFQVIREKPLLLTTPEGVQYYLAGVVTAPTRFPNYDTTLQS